MSGVIRPSNMQNKANNSSDNFKIFTKYTFRDEHTDINSAVTEMGDCLGKSTLSDFIIQSKV